MRYQPQGEVWRKGPGANSTDEALSPRVGPKPRREQQRTMLSAQTKQNYNQRSLCFAHEASRGACCDKGQSTGSVEVASTHDPSSDWQVVSYRRRRGCKVPQRAMAPPPQVAKKQIPPRSAVRESTTQAKPKPAPQPPRARFVPDFRPLPLPEPYDKNAPHPSRNQRHQEDWTWNAWRDYIFDAASRKWNKPSIKRVLKLRDQYPANRKMDFTKTSELWTKRGWIYGLFHFASGRWYVGQTSREYWVRAEEHWHSRKRLTDVLHNALANEISPFSFVVFPLEKIADNLFQSRTRK